MSDHLITLPVELIYKILDNVPLVDILSSVCLVNKCLRSVSLNCSRSQLDFSYVNTSIGKSQFDSICTQMLYSTSQVESLILFDKNDLMTSVKNDFFFSRFNIIDQTFPNLRSLTLTRIKYETWCLFKPRLPPLITTLSIYLYLSDSGSFACVSNASGILNGLLFLSSLLQRLSVKMTDVYESCLRISPPNLTVSSSVQYLRIDYVTIDLLSLLAVAPMLHTVQCRFETSKLKVGQIHHRHMYLQQLRIKLNTITWKKMAKLLSSFPRLVYLVVSANNLNNDMADGFEWARMLQQIKHFEFKFQFSYHTFRNEPLNLDSFRTKFWLKEKKWFVTHERTLDSDDDSSILYSNFSSLFNYPPHQMIATRISESTTSELESFSHVRCLTINDRYLKYPYLHRYRHVKELYLSQVTTTFPKTFSDLVACLDTSQIVTCTVGSEWSRNPSYEHIEFLRSLPRLRQLKVSAANLDYLFLHHWPYIVDLRIEKDFASQLYILSSNGLNELCCSFPHIKRLDIPLSFIHDLLQFLNRMQMILTDIIIRQSSPINNEQLLTYEWIEQNTELKNSHYISSSDFWNFIRIWF